MSASIIAATITVNNIIHKWKEIARYAGLYKMYVLVTFKCMKYYIRDQFIHTRQDRLHYVR